MSIPVSPPTVPVLGHVRAVHARELHVGAVVPQGEPRLPRVAVRGDDDGHGGHVRGARRLVRRGNPGAVGRDRRGDRPEVPRRHGGEGARGEEEGGGGGGGDHAQHPVVAGGEGRGGGRR